MSDGKRLKSAIVIAKLLDCEGFTDYTANQVERYWKQNANLTDRQRRSLARVERALSELAKGLSEGDRRVLGKFVGLHKKMAFETGLRMGLTCMAVRNGREYFENVGRHVSLEEARWIAFETLRKANRDLEEERIAESKVDDQEE